MLEFLSSFYPGHKDHIHFVEIAHIRDADNEIDIFFKTLEGFWQIQITGKQRLWMLVPLEFKPQNLYGQISSRVRFPYRSPGVTCRQDKPQIWSGDIISSDEVLRGKNWNEPRSFNSDP